jgi:hypothetical protein
MHGRAHRHVPLNVRVHHRGDDKLDEVVAIDALPQD